MVVENNLGVLGIRLFGRLPRQMGKLKFLQ
jgi:hypothetical protein